MDAGSSEHGIQWLDDHNFVCRDVAFQCSWTGLSTRERFNICKERSRLERFEQTVTGHGLNVVEIGILQGGSTALLTLLTRPRTLVAIEFSGERIHALDQFIEQRGLQEVVHPYYGVDQGDRRTVARIVDSHMGGEPLDLVIDDASHLLEPTRATFEELFPRMRPGGLYIIEDWSGDIIWNHMLTSHLSDPTSPGHAKVLSLLEQLASDPTDSRARAARSVLEEREEWSEGYRLPFDSCLPRLAVEILMAKAFGLAAIGDISIRGNLVVVERGDHPLEVASFSIADEGLARMS